MLVTVGRAVARSITKPVHTTGDQLASNLALLLVPVTLADGRVALADRALVADLDARRQGVFDVQPIARRARELRARLWRRRASAQLAGTALFAFALLNACGCASRHASPSLTEKRTMSKAPPSLTTLITYQSGAPIMREDTRDDGDRMMSTVQDGRRQCTVIIRRSTREVELECEGRRTQRVLPDATLALENGNWAAYAIAGEWYRDATADTPVSVWLPSKDKTLDATIRVERTGSGARTVYLRIAGLTITTELSADGHVLRAEVPQQRLEILPADKKPASAEPRALPPGAVRTAIEIPKPGFHLRGEMWAPVAVSEPVPFVVLVAGSGPTDRDGNSVRGLRTDLYRQLAEGLLERGIGTVRFDKRGVGESSFPGLTAEPTVDDNADDLQSVVTWTKIHARVSRMIVAGHSEGALIALVAYRRVAIDALVFLAAPGRKASEVLAEQLSKKGSPEAVAALPGVFADIRQGKAPTNPPPPLDSLFRPPSVSAWQSLLDLDPAAMLRSVTCPVTIVHGELDHQVPPSDARILHAAAPASALSILPTANHVLKQVTDAGEQSSYVDPRIPIAPGVLDAMFRAASDPR